jgi:hypothetical protein
MFEAELTEHLGYEKYEAKGTPRLPEQWQQPQWPAAAEIAIAPTPLSFAQSCIRSLTMIQPPFSPALTRAGPVVLYLKHVSGYFAALEEPDCSYTRANLLVEQQVCYGGGWRFGLEDKLAPIFWHAFECAGIHRQMDFLFIDLANPIHRNQPLLLKQPTCGNQ